jgi:hypothetical protein
MHRSLLLLAMLPLICGSTTLIDPPRTRIIVSDPGQHMYTIYIDGTGRYDLPWPGFTPSWTPDGRILFALGYEVNVMDPDGGNMHQIGPSFSEVGQPYKPQMVGDLIIVSVLLPTPNGKIYAMRADGRGLTYILDGNMAFLSPDGSWFAYMLQTFAPDTPAGFHREVWKASVNGVYREQLTDASDPLHPDANAPAISPDGTQLAIFWGTADYGQPVTSWGRRDVALMPADGGTPKVLVASTPITTSTDWSTYPPPPTLVSADNPAFFRDASGRQWVIYEGNSPFLPYGGTFIIGIDGQDDTWIRDPYLSFSNEPMRNMQ